MFPSAYVSVRLCFRPPASLPVCTPASLRLRPPVPLPVCVSASLYPRLSASLPVCTPSVCTLNTVAHRALFHRSLSTYPVLFVLLACPVLSFFPLSYLFIPLLPLFLFLFLFHFLFLFFSDIFRSYSPDSSCSSRDTPFSVKKPVSRACSAKLRRTTCSDTPF